MPRKWALLICFVFVVISIFWFVNDKYIVKRERKSDTIEKLKDSARTTFGNKLVDSGLLDFSSNQLGELPDNILAQLLGSVVNSSTHMYGAKDNHGTSLDCLRIISTTVTGVVRYLGVYHHMRKDIKKYQIHLAQSFDLMQWEFLRVLVTNADMPSFGVDVRTGWILLVYEDFISGSGLVPCSIGIRLYKGVHKLIAGDSAVKYVAPNTFSKIEGTPNVYSYDSLRGYASIGFHFFNETLKRDEVAWANLTNFPEVATWNTVLDDAHNLALTRIGATGNIGARSVLSTQENGQVVICEGNIQGPPLHKTKWDQWRVWLLRRNSSKVFSVTKINLKTHLGSQGVGNPFVAIVPNPDKTESGIQRVLFVSYFLFGEGAKKGESGQLIFTKKLKTHS
eukprot:m.67169 g.67169  ORF g.67169 m.67169 type:complete len:394 (-) comp11867_c0_seq4:59-1240(-)